MHRHLALRLATAGAALVLAASGAAAQSLGPMRGQVQSMYDRFALRLMALNYADTAAVYTIRVLNPDFTPVADARLSQPQVSVAANSSESFIVLVPFAPGEAQREVLVCSESEPFAFGAQMVRGQVCGRYFGQRLSRR